MQKRCVPVEPGARKKHFANLRGGASGSRRKQRANARDGTDASAGARVATIRDGQCVASLAPRKDRPTNTDDTVPPCLVSPPMDHAAADVAAPTEDPFGGRAFISPAKIRILLTPAGPDVTPGEFEKWAAHVRQFESIAIADLPTSQTGRAGPGESLLRK